ncbi:MAG: DUF3352 domain-containing protein [Anaerolineales bacterium]|nr:DUF3352 domain-containing protein [Anaerolineales bacterium]
MNMNNEPFQQAQPLQPAAKKSNKTLLYIGCGCLIVIAICAIIGLGIFGYMYFFNGSDPISAVVPNDALAYANVDFLQSQSAQFNDVVSIAQGIAGVKKQPLMDALDEAMQNELNMSFKSEVVPWMGQHGGLAIVSGDFNTGDAQVMFIMETRSASRTDQFLSKFIVALEDQRHIKFEKKTVGGATLYVYKSASNAADDMVVARVKKLVYIANSEDAVLKSINLKSGDSLAKSSKYKDAMAALPKGSMSSMYINGNNITDYISSLSNGIGAPSANQFADSGINALALSASLEKVGLRLDVATTYDPTKLNDFNKESLKTKYLAPKVDKLVPENTFFFLDINSAQNPARLTQADNPLYTKDVQEALDLFEKQYGVSIKKLLGLLNGEFAVAVGPSNDGLFATTAQVNVGGTIFAGTNDEAGANIWLEGARDALSKQGGMELGASGVTLGGYQLQKVTAQGLDGQLLFYGADKGYMILGTSQDILENGLGGKNTLANNAVYRDTWKAFPSGSMPYLYMNVSALIDFYKSSGAGGGLGDAEAELRRIPVLAAALNNSGGYTRSVTMIFFIK